MKGGNRACILDRDGVLNVDHGYVCSQDRFEWIEGAVEAVSWLNRLGIMVLVATNQSGIARGKFTLQQFEQFMLWMNEELAKSGAHLDGWFVCPHHPDEGVEPFRTSCECRKPKPGLFLQAIEKFELDAGRCFSVGDKLRDIEASMRAGVRGELFLGGNLLDFVMKVESWTP